MQQYFHKPKAKHGCHWIRLRSGVQSPGPVPWNHKDRTDVGLVSRVVSSEMLPLEWKSRQLLCVRHLDPSMGCRLLLLALWRAGWFERTRFFCAVVTLTRHSFSMSLGGTWLTSQLASSVSNPRLMKRQANFYILGRSSFSLLTLQIRSSTLLSAPGLTLPKPHQGFPCSQLLLGKIWRDLERRRKPEGQRHVPEASSSLGSLDRAVSFLWSFLLLGSGSHSLASSPRS